MRAAKAILPGNPSESELFQRIISTDTDERMPPEGHALSKPEIKAIESWIAKGAPIPPKDLPEDDPLEHWAFQKIVKPAIPANVAVTHPVDAFLEAKHRELGLRAQPMAEPSIAIRRLYLDLVGLPPTPEQLADDSSWEEICRSSARKSAAWRTLGPTLDGCLEILRMVWSGCSTAILPENISGIGATGSSSH